MLPPNIPLGCPRNRFLFETRLSLGSHQLLSLFLAKLMWLLLLLLLHQKRGHHHQWQMTTNPFETKISTSRALTWIQCNLGKQYLRNKVES